MTGRDDPAGARSPGADTDPAEQGALRPARVTYSFGRDISALAAGAPAPAPPPIPAPHDPAPPPDAPATQAAKPETGPSMPGQPMPGPPMPGLPVPGLPVPVRAAPPSARRPPLAAPDAGSPAWSMRGPILHGLFALFVLIFGFGFWAVYAQISGAIVAPGRVEVEQNRQVVQHPDGGVVAAISVVEGQSVAAGDVLLQLDGVQLLSEMTIVQGTLTELRARRARLEAERDGVAAPVYPPDLVDMAATRPEVAEQMQGQTRLFEARAETARQEVEQLSQRITQIEVQIEGITAQSDALTIQLDLIRRELASQQSLLDKGLAQASAVLALQREEARLLGMVGELASQGGQAQERITETQVQIGRVAVQMREQSTAELRDIIPQELELAERRRALAERIDRLDIRAPVSGIVLGLAVTTPKAVIRPADAILYLVPQDRPLVISAQVAPIHIDQIHVGQPVELVFSAFSSNTPRLMGRVSVVSADAFTDQSTQVSFYRIEVVLDAGEFAKLGDRVLLPGMPVDAFVQTEARSPLTYLLKPFTDYFDKAFREG